MGSRKRKFNKNTTSKLPPMRIDPPHDIKKADPLSEVIDADSDSDLSTSEDSLSAEQVIAQAGQLAGHLRARQRDLDRREAQTNARIAKLEQDLRSSRIWFQEREREFAEREEQLQQQVAELEEHAVSLSAAQFATDGTDEEKENIQKIEAILKEQQEQLRVEQERLAKERDQVRQKAHQDEQRLIYRERQCEIELQKRREQLDRRTRFLDKRTAVLEQLKSDVARMHRESLQLRLLTEQMWSQLADKVAPAQLTKLLSETQRKLADHHRGECDEVARQREQLGELSSKLDHRGEELNRKRSELEDWVARRQQEIEEQAARLVAREQELDRQEQHNLKLQSKWNDERQEYERRIRVLTRRSLRTEQAAA